MRAYSRLEGTGSVAEVAGPSIAAGLYSALGVAALVVDAASYLVSAACFRYMRPWGVRYRAQRFDLGPGSPSVSGSTGPIRCCAGSSSRRSRSTRGGPIFVTVLPILAYQGLGLSVARSAWPCRSAPPGPCSARSSRRRSPTGWARAARWPGACCCTAWSGSAILAAPALPPAAGDRGDPGLSTASSCRASTCAAHRSGSRG